MAKYYPPTFQSEAFNCVHCGVYSTQTWRRLQHSPDKIRSHSFQDTLFMVCVCHHCEGDSYWYEDRMIVPSSAPVPPAHEDLPENCKNDYDEARDIVSRSPKAAAALLRLILQKLMIELGEKGKNINEDIGNLVKKGLPSQVQQALDYCRVVGNNAVHPGEISLDDNPEIAHTLFEMINLIVEKLISEPKKIDDLFNSLPEGVRAAIDKRDNNK